MTGSPLPLAKRGEGLGVRGNPSKWDGIEMGTLYNRPTEITKRRQLRHDSPPAEVVLWQRLRNRQLGGYKFKRQFGIAHYVTDFCCAECKLAIELDGPSHEDSAEYDAKRSRYFESLGLSVVRFTNEQVYKNLIAVMEHILKHCEERS